MLNTAQKIGMIIITSISLILLSSSSKAVLTSSNIYVKCNQNEGGQWVAVGEIDEDVIYGLLTVGIMVPEQKDPIIDWTEYRKTNDIGPVEVKAVCGSPMNYLYDGFFKKSGLVDMVNMKNQNNLTGGKSIYCKKGEGIWVNFKKPLCQNEEYSYVGELLKMDKYDYVLVDREEAKKNSTEPLIIRDEDDKGKTKKCCCCFGW